LVNALPGEPDGCNLELYLDGGYRKPSERMGGVCWTGTAVGSGWCDFYEKEQPDPEPLDAESISIDEIGLTWKNDWREKEKVVLQTRLAATVNKRTQEKVMLRVKATCGDQEDRERPLGPNLEFVGAGESVRTRTGMFRAAPLEKPDGKCEVTVLAKPLLGKDAVELGTFCLKGSRINTGACKGSGKPAAIDKEVVLRPKKRRSK
jgi:hypothetical protein